MWKGISCLLEIIVKPTSDKPNSLTQWASALGEFMSISRAVSKWLLFARHICGMVKLKSSGRRMVMQFALLIYEAPEAFAARESDGTDPYTGAWRGVLQVCRRGWRLHWRRPARRAGDRNYGTN